MGVAGPAFPTAWQRIVRASKRGDPIELSHPELSLLVKERPRPLRADDPLSPLWQRMVHAQAVGIARTVLLSEEVRELAAIEVIAVRARLDDEEEDRARRAANEAFSPRRRTK